MQNPNEPKTGLPVEPKTALTIETLRNLLHREFRQDFAFIIYGRGEIIAEATIRGEVMATAKVNRMSGEEITS